MERRFTEKEKEVLMTAIESNENSKSRVRKQQKHVGIYDFRSPQKFSKDNVRTLEKVFDTFSRSISNYFSANLLRNVKIEVEVIKQISYQQYINDLPVKLPVLTFFKMPPFDGTVMVDISPEFAYKILEMLLGGKGGEQNIPKELSEIDKIIIAKQLAGLAPHFKTAWSEFINVEPEYDTMLTNVLGNQILAPNEPVALIKLSVRYDKDYTFINVCIPYISIEKHLNSFVNKQWFKGVEEKIDQKEKIKDRLKGASVNLEVKLGETKLSLEEFLRLSTGDVIKLKEKITNPAVVYVENMPCFYAKPGVIGKNSGVEILDIILKEG